MQYNGMKLFLITIILQWGRSTHFLPIVLNVFKSVDELRDMKMNLTLLESLKYYPANHERKTLELSPTTHRNFDTFKHKWIQAVLIVYFSGSMWELQKSMN